MIGGSEKSISLRCYPCTEKCTVCSAGMYLNPGGMCTPTCKYPLVPFTDASNIQQCVLITSNTQAQINLDSKLPKAFGTLIANSVFNDARLKANH